jgi:hypothetical protein
MTNLHRTTGLAGIEPTAYRLGGDRSILLSYSPKRGWKDGAAQKVLYPLPLFP